MRAGMAGVLAGALAGTASAGADPEVEVFTDLALFPVVAPASAKVYDLGAARRIVAELGRGLPRGQAAAEAVVRSRFAAEQQALRVAYAGQARAVGYGVAKIPAMVFDHGAAVVYGVTDIVEAAVVYGVTDIGEAATWFRRWRGW